MGDLKVSLTRKDTDCIWLDSVTRDYILVVTVKCHSVCEATEYPEQNVAAVESLVLVCALILHGQA